MCNGKQMASLSYELIFASLSCLAMFTVMEDLVVCSRVVLVLPIPLLRAWGRCVEGFLDRGPCVGGLTSLLHPNFMRAEITRASHLEELPGD